jgi:hypothetical protein
MLELIHWVALVVASTAALIYFRDLGDITQAFMKVKRKNMIFAIRHERLLVLTALIGSAIAWATTFFYGAGIAILAYVLVEIYLF